MQEVREARPIRLSADRVVDGTGRAPFAPGFVVIHGGRITDVDRGEPGGKPANDDAMQRVEFPGCTIVPGFVDSHVHLTFSSSPSPFRELQEDSEARLILRGVANARRALQAGVTTVRDLAGRNRTTLELRDAVAAGIIPGPRIFASGRPITSPEGHCYFLGGGVRGVPAVRALAHELIAEGVDVIKVMATGGNMTTASDPWTPQFTVEESGCGRGRPRGQPSRHDPCARDRGHSPLRRRWGAQHRALSDGSGSGTMGV